MFFPFRPLVPVIVPMLLAAALAVCAVGVEAADSLQDSGVAMIPEDAAFVSATLRAREQYDRFEKSNVWAALRKLPGVVRAMEEIDDQKSQPGSPLSMLDTFMQLPENEQALALLKDMVSTDTFVYGDPSCVTFVELLKKIQQAQNAAGVLRMASGDVSLGAIDVEIDGLEEGIGVEEMDDEDEEGATNGTRGVRVMPVRFQAAEQISADELTTRLVVKTLSENVDKIVVPDVVWGFKTTKLDAATSQLKRIEVLAKLVTQASPELAESLKRQKVAGGEVITFTLKPDANLIREAFPGLEDHQEALEKVFDKVDDLEIADGSVPADALLASSQDAQALGRCLGELDDRTQTVIRTAFFEGVTYEALAQRMDTPLGTVKSWIRRGLLKLRGCLEP